MWWLEKELVFGEGVTRPEDVQKFVQSATLQEPDRPLAITQSKSSDHVGHELDLSIENSNSVDTPTYIC
jgi:hypothetical protein